LKSCFLLVPRFVWNHDKRLAFYPEKLLSALDATPISQNWPVSELLWNLLAGCAADVADFESKKLQIGLDPGLPRFQSDFFGQVTIKAECPDCPYSMELKTDVLLR
jgi:hypothetical protein